jgi:hypothetical protein
MYKNKFTSQNYTKSAFHNTTDWYRSLKNIYKNISYIKSCLNVDGAEISPQTM